MSTAGWAPWATHHKLSRTEERVRGARGTQATGGSATRGSESPTGSGHGSMGGPTLRSNASPFRRREKNELLAEFLFRNSVQRVEPREIWVRQLIGPLVEFSGHVVGRQRAAMGVEQEDQLHQDGGFLDPRLSIAMTLP